MEMECRRAGNCWKDNWRSEFCWRCRPGSRTNVDFWVLQDLTLLTLVFGESYLSTVSNAVPSAHKVPIPAGSSAELLPPSASRLSQDSTLTYSVPSREAPAFLAALKEIPAAAHGSENEAELDDVQEQKLWIMRAARGASKTNSLKDWAKNSWTAFLDLVKVRVGAKTRWNDGGD